MHRPYARRGFAAGFVEAWAPVAESGSIPSVRSGRPRQRAGPPERCL